MVLTALQSLLDDLYALEVAYDIGDFLITDELLAEKLDHKGRQTDEKLLIAESPDSDAQVALYLHRDLVQRLQENNPANHLNADNLRDFWTAFEGVSHFTYYAFNAGLEKPVTLLEMELQAEVDKFIVTTLLLQRQEGKAPSALHHWLFELPRFDPQLSSVELTRYQDANRYAGKYCLKLASRLGSGVHADGVRDELRHFYRLSQPAKIRHIDA
jgi:hypothetical protein